MKEEYREFVGIYDESVPVELCEMFVENYEEAKKNRTFIDISKENNIGITERKTTFTTKKDEVAVVTPLSSTIYPKPPVEAYFKYLQECMLRYMDRYGIVFNGTLFNDIFKIHKVRKSEGYHVWHYESSSASTSDRFMVYMTYLEVPKKGGETEFLHQSLRIEPVVGRTLLWPATYTHMHRGLMPIDGEKMYITGWFNSSKGDFDVAGK